MVCLSSLESFHRRKTPLEKSGQAGSLERQQAEKPSGACSTRCLSSLSHRPAPTPLCRNLQRLRADAVRLQGVRTASIRSKMGLWGFPTTKMARGLPSPIRNLMLVRMPPVRSKSQLHTKLSLVNLLILSAAGLSISLSRSRLL